MKLAKLWFMRGIQRGLIGGFLAGILVPHSILFAVESSTPNALDRQVFCELALSLVSIEAQKSQGFKNVFGVVDLAVVQTVKPWKFSPKEETRFQSVFSLSDSTLTEKIYHLAAAITEVQAGKLPTKKKQRFLSSIQFRSDLAHSLKDGASPNYANFLNIVFYGPFNPKHYPILEMHEGRHSYTRNRSAFLKYLTFGWFFLNPFLPIPHSFSILDTFEEADAIGAQWEWSSRIPEKLRMELMRNLETELEAGIGSTQLSVDYSLKLLTYYSLERASWSKKDFVAQMLQDVGHNFGSNLERKYFPLHHKLMPQLASHSLRFLLWLNIYYFLK